MTPKDEPPSLEGVKYATEKEWRETNNSSRNINAAGPKQKQCYVMGVSGGKSKVRCCKEQNCTATCNVRSMNQGKLHVAKQEMVRVKINILGISELKWMGLGKFNSEPLYPLL